MKPRPADVAVGRLLENTQHEVQTHVKVAAHLPQQVDPLFVGQRLGVSPRHARGEVGLVPWNNLLQLTDMFGTERTEIQTRRLNAIGCTPTR